MVRLSCVWLQKTEKKGLIALSCNRLLHAVDPFEEKAAGEARHKVMLNTKINKFCDKQIAAPPTLKTGLVSLQTLLGSGVGGLGGACHTTQQ